MKRKSIKKQNQIYFAIIACMISWLQFSEVNNLQVNEFPIFSNQQFEIELLGEVGKLSQCSLELIGWAMSIYCFDN